LYEKHLTPGRYPVQNIYPSKKKRRRSDPTTTAKRWHKGLIDDIYQIDGKRLLKFEKYSDEEK